MSLWVSVNRKKTMGEMSLQESKLARVLTTFDLIGLGVGSTLGVGIYVLAGAVAKTIAGPAVVLSFLFAAIASALAGLCFAEFGSRVPKAGSAYIYSYYCVGELVAFVIGWNLILEYLIGCASVASGISTYIDSLTNGDMKMSFLNAAPLPGGFLSDYVDFFAFAVCILLSLALAFGIKESTIVNNIFTVCNVGVVLFIIITGIWKADGHNWALSQDEVADAEQDAGEGGFLPFGMSGVIKGAAVCFYGFVGFDCIATTGEEVKNPQRAIPIAIITAMAAIFLCYFGVSTVLTLMLPYYNQDINAPIPYAYEIIGWPAVRWVVAIGSLFGLSASLFGAMFPLPRIIYAMASDGLLFPFLGKVHPRFKTPLQGTLFAGLVTAVMAAFFSLHQLVNLMAIGTLLAYTVVAMCVLILRFSPPEEDEGRETRREKGNKFGESTNLVTLETRIRVGDIVRGYLSRQSSEPTRVTTRIVTINIFLFSMLSVALGLIFLYLEDEVAAGMVEGVAPASAVIGLMLVVLLSIHIQPRADCDLTFKMPLVPLLPCLSIFINVYLMVMLDWQTWIRYAVWMAIGIIPYLFWYLWKYRKGGTRLNSSYEIRRINTKRLNDMSARLYSQKRTHLNGKLNSVFILDDGDLRPELQYATEEVAYDMELQDTAVEWAPKPKPIKWFAEDENNNNSDGAEEEVHEAPPFDQSDAFNMDTLINESYDFLTEMTDDQNEMETAFKSDMINRDSVVYENVRSFTEAQRASLISEENLHNFETSTSFNIPEENEDNEVAIIPIMDEGIVQTANGEQNDVEKEISETQKSDDVEEDMLSPEDKKIARRQRKSPIPEPPKPPLSTVEIIENHPMEETALVGSRKKVWPERSVRGIQAEQVQDTDRGVRKHRYTDGNISESSKPPEREQRNTVGNKYLETIGSGRSTQAQNKSENFRSPKPQSVSAKYHEAIEVRTTNETKPQLNRKSSKPILVLEGQTKPQITENPAINQVTKVLPPPKLWPKPPKPPIMQKPIVKEESKEAEPSKRVTRSNSKLAEMYMANIQKKNEETGECESTKPPLTLMEQIRMRPKLKHVEVDEARKKEPVAKAPEVPEDHSKASIRNRLTRLLESQIAMNKTSLQKPIPTEVGEDADIDQPGNEMLDEEARNTYKTIRTLSKAAMRGKLENILALGPPKRASFRNSLEVDAARSQKVNALREIEQQAIQSRVEAEPVAQPVAEAVSEPKPAEKTNAAERTEDRLTSKQRLLMGDVLRTIRLKGTLNKPEFADEF